ncbi:MAG: ABC transporter permease [Proteobacteria bacterium]|nr:ABC transporter permease [Pseudomonadota bacterium]MBU4294807.1 ABC transporter permease [Pseudomonadota bacterium]MCG2748085.1 ABC transporter permease [Desulfobulbaceae bacterium]
MKDQLRRMKALISKEFVQVMRDPSSLLIAFVLPMILLFLFGYGVSLDAKRLKIGVAVEDSGAEAASLASSFLASPYFEARISRDARVLEADLLAGRSRGIVVIANDFSRRLHSAGTAATIQVITDGSETNTANYVQNYAQGVVSTWTTIERMKQGNASQTGARLVPRIWFNPELESRDSLVPGAIAIIMAIIGTLLTALVVSREWERGTMEAMMATPVGIGEVIIGKLIPYFLLGMVAMLGSVAIAVFLFKVPFHGSLPALLLTSVAFLLAALGQGLLISTVAKNQFVAAQVAMVTGFLPAFLLSGFIFEIASMPLPIRVLTHIIPARYLVTNLQTLFLVGDVWPLLLPNVLILLGLAAVLFFITARKTAKRLR